MPAGSNALSKSGRQAERFLTQARICNAGGAARSNPLKPSLSHRAHACRFSALTVHIAIVGVIEVNPRSSLETVLTERVNVLMNIGRLRADCSSSFSEGLQSRCKSSLIPTERQRHTQIAPCLLRISSTRHQRWRSRPHTPRAADLTAGGSQEADDEPPVVSQVFPRIRESNPYRRLGISEEASFEEIQDARNFLYEAYKHHAPSREAIELAFDRILKSAFKRREKFGFQPPKTGRKTDMRADVLGPTIVERVKDSIEPNIGLATFVNDGSIFLVLGVWAAMQASATDPTFPIALALIYSAYKFFTKRKNRFPDGPHFGGSPIWGALGMTVLGLALGALVSTLVLRFIPFPAAVQPEGIGLLVFCVVVGLFTLFFR